MKKYIYELRFLIFAQLGCYAIFTLMLAIIPLINKALFDSVTTEKSVVLSTILIYYISCIIVYLIFVYIHNIFTWKAAIQFEVSMKKDFFNAITKYDYKRFSKKDIGEYISLQGNDITALEMDYLTPMTDIFKSIIMFIIYGIALFVFVDWRIAAVIFVASVISVVCTRFTAKPLADRRKNYLNQMGKYVSVIKDFLEGFKLINSRTTKSIIREHEHILDKTAQKRFFYGKFKSLNFLVNGTLKYAVHITAFAIVGYLLIRGEISVGTGIATFGFIECFISPIESIMYDVSAINSVKDVKKKVLDHLNNCSSENNDTVNEFNDCISLNCITIKNDSFSINDLSYTFRKNEKYAIIGHSGSGKSTIINAIMKYCTLENGSITIDNRNINDLNLANIVCCINQNEFVFSNDFHNNVTVFSSYNDENIEQYTQLVNKRMIDKITEKENCQLLSGGEKQIIGIVRMLLSDTPICLLDEPFSALDVNTSQIVQNELLDMADKTIIVVTHKLSENLSKFDNIILMEEGRIIKCGSFSEIVDSTEYKKLLSESDDTI